MQNDKVADNSPRRGGRPSQAQAGRLGERILDIASQLFLTEGYGATSIEAIAKRAGMSKRTFYHRFDDKADIFGAVVHRLITRMRPSQPESLFKNGTLKEILERLAKTILHAALSAEALALHRLIVSEAKRFPELAMIMDAEGSRREAVTYIAALLQQQTEVKNATFAAEQFLHMVVALPQRRALGMGKPMNAAELDAWAHDTVHLFLNGCRCG